MTSSLPRFLPSLTALAAVLGAAAVPAQEHKELGRMWLFENPPLAYLEKEYGFKPDQAWLNRLRLASIRFGDLNQGWCSSSFVSPKGLIMTNHHCVRDNIGAVQGRNNWVRDGYFARSLEDEVRLRSGDGTPVAVQQLLSMSDVTSKMNEGIKAGDDDAAIDKKRTDNEKKILEEAKKQHKGMRPQVVKLHNGARFHLYIYKVWDDVRLVCAPHLQAAHFGGDPDNFTYPRYSIDFAFCRAYENGKPADTAKHYFKWSLKGAKPDELVFVTGNPGSTGRLLTKSQMDFLRDAQYPIRLGVIDSQVSIVGRYAARNPNYKRRVENTLLGLQNSQKAIRGYLSGLLDKKLMAEKVEHEKKFMAEVMAKPALAKKYGKAWDRLKEINAELTKLEPIAQFCSAYYSQVLGRGISIVSAFDETAEETEREAAMAQAKNMRITAATFRNPIVTDLMVAQLELAKKWLPADNPFRKHLIGDMTGKEALAKLRKSKVVDATYVDDLLDGGKEAIAKSDDPVIMAAREFVPLAKKAAKRIKELKAQENVQSVLIGRALFDVYGDKISPDATMTLRFADGRVKGYNYNGTVAPWRTSFYGMFGRNSDFDGEDPFHLPKAWLEAKDKIDMTKAVNFVSTNDIIGGNSGSPVVNADLEVVGLIFDGNIEQLPNRFLFKENNERSISVHVDAIMESLLKIYGAQRVADELLGKKMPESGQAAEPGKSPKPEKGGK